MLPRITRTMAETAARVTGETWQQAFMQLNAKRDEMIEREQTDPLHYGYEPEAWHVADCLLGLPWVPAEEAEKVRQQWGFKKRVRVLMLNGGYRAGKTEYAAKRTVMILLWEKFERPKAWCFSVSADMSREIQQPAIWKYLPAHLKDKEYRTPVRYISYKYKQGFAEDSFTLDNYGWCSFRNYNQEEDNVEGAAPLWVWLDEPPDPGLVKALFGRIAERDGWMVLTFVPKHGYTATVKDFQDSAETMATSTAWLLPTDGGKPDLTRAFRRVPVGEWTRLRQAATGGQEKAG